MEQRFKKENMMRDRAKVIVKESVDNYPHNYVDLGCTGAVLDGDFTAEQLEAIVFLLKAKSE